MYWNGVYSVTDARLKGTRIFASRLGLFSVFSLVLAAFCGAVLADADPDQTGRVTPPGRHLLLVPDTPAGVLALARSDARVVARYRSYSLVEAAGDDAQRLRAAGGERRDDMREVTTASGELDPAADRPSLAAKLAPDRDEVLALVQFVGPPKPAWVDRLRATGARVVGYQAQNAYIAHAAGPAVERVAGLLGTDPAVRAVVPLEAADKVEGRAEGAARYVVSSVPGVGVPTGPGRSATIAGLRTQSVELTPAQVDELAGDPAVVSVERDAPPTPDDERAGAVLAGQSDYLAWHDARFPGLTPFDTTIDVTDSGLDDPADPSADFHVDGVSSNPGRIAYDVDYTGDGDTVDCTGHGTNVASIAAGYNASTGGQNQDGSGFSYGLGIAPLATLGVSKIFRCDGSGLNLSTGQVAAISAAAAGSGADISNNSWGLGAPGFYGAYSARARAYDSVVRDSLPAIAGQQPLVEVFSAGNDGADGAGTLNAEASAKNVITVGASEGTRLGSASDGCGLTTTSDNAGQVASFSARGPTNDGRLKPDLVAPGTRVTGARPPAATYDPSTNELCSPAFNLAYSMASGTSQAAPQVSGAAALVRHWYLDTVSGGDPAVAGDDEGHADQLRLRPRRRPRPEPGLGEGQPGVGVRLDGARVLRPAARRRADRARPDRGQGLHGAGHQQAAEGHAGVDRPAARRHLRRRVRQRPRPRGRGRRAHLPGQRLRWGLVAQRRVGGRAQQRRERLPPARHDRAGGRDGARHRDQRRRRARERKRPRPGLRARGVERRRAGRSGADGRGAGRSPEATATTRSSRASRRSCSHQCCNQGIGDAMGVSGVLAGAGQLSVTQGSSAYADVPEDGALVVPNTTPFTSDWPTRPPVGPTWARP